MLKRVQPFDKLRVLRHDAKKRRCEPTGPTPPVRRQRPRSASSLGGDMISPPNKGRASVYPAGGYCRRAMSEARLARMTRHRLP